MSVSENQLPAPGRATPGGGSHSVASVRQIAGRSFLAALVGFHGWLFWVHITTGRLWEPVTAMRWVAAALIVAGFLSLRRAGWPLTSGRRALVLWLLVVMLHACAVVGAADHAPAAAIPETVNVVLAQIAGAPAALLGAALLLLLARLRVERPLALTLAEVRRFVCGVPLPGHIFRFSPRPPPQLLPA